MRLQACFQPSHAAVLQGGASLLREWPYLGIMIFCPLQLLQQVAQVAFDRNVVLPGLQFVVKVFVVDGVLLENHAVAYQEVGQAVGGHGTVDVYLILVLQSKSV